jgi:hypothetical protein
MASHNNELLQRALDVAEEARSLLLVQGYDGPCMGDEIAPLMDTIVQYDLARQSERDLQNNDARRKGE